MTEREVGTGYRLFASGRLGLNVWRVCASGAPTLLCFPFAGGGPAAFRELLACLPERWGLAAIDYPGHVRTSGDALNDVDAIRDLVLKFLPERIWDNVILAGHSLGGYIAVKVGVALERAGKKARGIVTSASVPPHLRDHRKPLQAMDDQALEAWICGLGGVPGEETVRGALFNIFKGAIRADVTAFEDAVFRDVLLRDTPMLCMAGEDDPLFSAVSVIEWARYATNIVTEIVPGNHLFVLSRNTDYARALLSWRYAAVAGA